MKKNKRKERRMGQEMKGREFYQAIKESRQAGTPELTPATNLDGPLFMV